MSRSEILANHMAKQNLIVYEALMKKASDKANADGDAEYDRGLCAKAEAISANKIAYAAAIAALKDVCEKNVGPPNAVSLMMTARKLQLEANEKQRHANPVCYVKSPSTYHKNNDVAIKAINSATQSADAIVTACNEAFKLEEDTTNAGIAAYNAAKNAGLSDFSALNAGCNAKYSSKNPIVRAMYRLVVPKSKWVATTKAL